MNDVAIKAEGAVIEAGSTWDMDPAEFRKCLERREANRSALIEWIKSTLKVDVDFGKIHVVGKGKCALGKDCPDPSHWSKDVLFKSGGEKIAQHLGLRQVFSGIDKYQEMTLKGLEVKQIILPCRLVNSRGEVVSEGCGARTVANDYGDLNKSLKMAEKSGCVDAVIRLGLSEIYTQDEESLDPEKKVDAEWVKQVAATMPPAQAQAQQPAPVPPRQYNQEPGSYCDERGQKALFAIVSTAMKRVSPGAQNHFCGDMIHWLFKVQHTKDILTSDAREFMAKFGYNKNEDKLAGICEQFIAYSNEAAGNAEHG